MALPLDAQEVRDVPPGTRVRVLAPTVHSGWTIGTVRSITDERIVIAHHRGAEDVRVPLAEIERFDRSLGTRTPLGGLLYRGRNGAMVGLATGATLGAALGTNEHVDFLDFLLMGSGAGLVIGAVTGAAVGLLWPGERWEPAEWQQMPLTIRPNRSAEWTISHRIRF